jgi:hypothetical protein
MTRAQALRLAKILGAFRAEIPPETFADMLALCATHIIEINPRVGADNFLRAAREIPVRPLRTGGMETPKTTITITPSKNQVDRSIPKATIGRDMESEE